MKNENKYYSINRLINSGAQYCMVIGSRSNGKTYSCLEYMLKEYCVHGSEFAIIRRWGDDFKGKRGKALFNALEDNNVIQKLTNNQWSNVVFQSMQFFFGKYDNGKLVLSDKPIGYAFAISQMEHDKSTSYPRVNNILFDEFMTRSEYGYLNNEFVSFMNVLSTIIRERGEKDNIRILLCGNSVNFTCPYFQELGLTNIKKMKPGDIDIYTYGDSGLKVAVEFAEPFKGKTSSNKYFAFNNPRLKMITGSDGEATWEIDMYPHLPYKYRPNQVILTYFIIFDGCTMQCEVIKGEGGIFTFIHRKTTEIRDPEHDLVFTPEPDPRLNWNTNILKIHQPKIRNIMSKVFDTTKFFYQDNELGEYMRNYLIWCRRN